MSEGEEPKKKIVVLKDSQFEELRQAMGDSGTITSEESLKAENEDLKEKLSLVAEQALTQKLSNFGVDVSQYDFKNPASQQAAIERLHELERQHNTGAPLSDAQYGKTHTHYSGREPDVLQTYPSLGIEEIPFDDQKTLFATLKAIANDSSDARRAQAQKFLSRLLKKELTKGEEKKEFQLEGSISEWLRNGKKSKPEFKKLNEEGSE